MKYDIECFLEYDFNKSAEESTNYLRTQILRKARKDLGYTLEEAAEGICSKSLLSRIEKNIVIPREETMAMLSKRMKVENFDVEFDSQKHRDIMMKSLEEHFSNGILSNYFEVAFNSDNFKVSLIRFAYYVTNKKFSKANEYYEKLKDSYFSFDKREIIYFYYFLALLLFYQHKNLLSYKLLKKIRETSISESFAILVKKLYIITALNVGRYNLLKGFIEEFQTDLLLGNYARELEEIDPYYTREIMLNEENDIANNVIDKAKGRSKNEKVALRSIIFYKNKEYKTALKYLNPIKNLDKHLIVYYVILLDLNNELEKAINFLVNLSIDRKHGVALEIEDFLKCKASEDPKKLYNFISERFFKEKKIEHYQFLKYIFISSYDFFKKKHCYKLATNIYDLFSCFKIELLFS